MWVLAPSLLLFSSQLLYLLFNNHWIIDHLYSTNMFSQKKLKYQSGFRAALPLQVWIFPVAPIRRSGENRFWWKSAVWDVTQSTTNKTTSQLFDNDIFFYQLMHHIYFSLSRSQQLHRPSEPPTSHQPSKPSIKPSAASHASGSWLQLSSASAHIVTAFGFGCCCLSILSIHFLPAVQQRRFTFM